MTSKLRWATPVDFEVMQTGTRAQETRVPIYLRWPASWAFFYHIIQKKINENRAREQRGIEENRINLIVYVQTRKTQGISTPLRILIFFPLD